MPVDDIELTSGKDDCLALRVGTQHFDLGPVGSRLLVRSAMNLAGGLRGRQVGPYVVVCDLMYSDYDADQQSESYAFLCVCETEALAAEVKAAIDDECALTRGHNNANVYIPDFPEKDLSWHGEDRVTSVQQALVHLRVALLVHESDSLQAEREHTYWKAMGFTPRESGELREFFASDDFDEVGEYDLDVDDLVAAARKYFGPDPEQPLLFNDEPAVVEKLRLWLDGATPEEITAVGIGQKEG